MDVQNHSLYTYKIPIQRVPSTEKLWINNWARMRCCSPQTG
jgi:hypothetical protein